MMASAFISSSHGRWMIVGAISADHWSGLENEIDCGAFFKGNIHESPDPGELNRLRLFLVLVFALRIEVIKEESEKEAEDD